MSPSTVFESRVKKCRLALGFLYTEGLQWKNSKRLKVSMKRGENNNLSAYKAKFDRLTLLVLYQTIVANLDRYTALCHTV